MVENLPVWIDFLFLTTVLGTLILFYYSNGKPKLLLSIIILWAILHSILAINGFYLKTDSIPPRFALIIGPAFLFIGYGLLPRQKRWMLKNRNTKISTFLHVVRIPVEIILYCLFLNKLIPEIMTFEGRNYDILAGITAILFGILYLKNIISPKVLIYWNIVGLILIMTILIIAIFSAEFPFQKFGFEQPNVGVGYFPYILLPALIVPIVIYTHLTDILKLAVEPKNRN